MKNKVYCVKLEKLKLGAIKLEPYGEEIRLFSTKKKAKKWLRKNGFIYGQRDFFAYPNNEMEWCHKYDTCFSLVYVTIKKIHLNDSKPIEVYDFYAKIREKEDFSYVKTASQIAKNC